MDMDQKLSPHFSLREMTQSSTALRLGIDNTPSQGVVNALTLVCDEILEPVRDEYGVPFSPSSGYRCPELNEAIGGSENSQHCLGQAVDFEVPGVDNTELCSFVSEQLAFDQLILEYYVSGQPNSGWIHASVVGENKMVVSDMNRSEVLTFDGSTYTKQ